MKQIPIKSIRELTAIQKHLSVKLKEAGYSGNEIAYKLSVSPACVSQYQKGKRGNEIPLREVSDKVSKLYNQLKKDKGSKLLTMLEVEYK